MRSGIIVFSNDFPSAVGIPTPTDGIDWSSGERATLRYKDGRTFALIDPPRGVKPERCPIVLREK